MAYWTISDSARHSIDRIRGHAARLSSQLSGSAATGHTILSGRLITRQIREELDRLESELFAVSVTANELGGVDVNTPA